MKEQHLIVSSNYRRPTFSIFKGKEAQHSYQMLASYYLLYMFPARKKVSEKTLHEKHIAAKPLS